MANDTDKEELATATTPLSVAGALPTAASTEDEQPTAEQQATDQRLEAQGILIDFLSEFNEKNYDWRNSENNKNSIYDLNAACGGGGTFNEKMIGMFGDGEIFSSLVNGSELKSRFLDFTTAQLSSITPVIKLIKVQQDESGNTTDFLIPFPTHAAWQNSITNSGQVLKNDLKSLNSFDIGNTTPLNVGLKSFNWQFEGSNPVSAKVDIKAEMVLYAKSLSDLIEPFYIFNTNPDQKDSEKIQFKSFKYVDLILRSGKKFNDAKQYDPAYYRIKIQIGWKTENTKLFSTKQLDSLKANTTTLILTLIDHKFDFDQDGSVKLTANYRAYYETLMASQDADFLRTPIQQVEVEKLKLELYRFTDILNSQDTNDSEKETVKKQYEQKTKDFNNLIDQLNKESFQSIISELQTKQAIYYVQVNNSEYQTAKSTNFDILRQSSGILDFQPAPTQIAKAAIDAVKNSNDENKTNDKLTSFVPQTKDGYLNISYFYLGDLFAIAIRRMYEKMETFVGEFEENGEAVIKAIKQTNVQKPKFLFGSIQYTDVYNSSTTKYANLLDVPISVEWFTQWFTNEIVSQNKELYPLLYFIRDLSSNLINQLTGRRDKYGSFKTRNILNTLNFNIKINDNYSGLDPLMDSKFLPNPLDIKNQSVSQNFGNLPATDLLAENVGEIVNKFTPRFGETNNIQEYIAIYCQDRRAPTTIECDEDIKRGRYHFYFGKDRGIVKKISFNRTQVTGLRELNYVRESNGLGLEQLMTPYDLDITMVGNNLMYNGMMIFINPSGFGRKIGQPNDPDSVSYKLKLGGYHLVYRVENSLGTEGFETKVKARWIGSGYSSSLVKDGTDNGNVYGVSYTPLTQKKASK